MNYSIPFIPERPSKPRENGLTMVIDKGLSLRQAEDFVSVAGKLTDYVKFGFGTSLIAENLSEKVKVYQQAGIHTYFGGTLFEVFYVRNDIDGFQSFMEKYGVVALEISDGSVFIPHDEKCELIAKLSKNFHVISEVGSKETGVVFNYNEWIQKIQDELDAGSVKVIAEARESGTVGIYGSDGNADTYLIDKIINKINQDMIIWETPLKSQQAWFVKLLGANVNLGNIQPGEVIALETLRLGLRGDTFFDFLPDDLKNRRIPFNA